MFTPGVGDVIAATGTRQVVTALASVLGLFLVTLCITYLVSVVRPAVTRRLFALSLNILGTTTGQMVSSQLSSRLRTHFLQATHAPASAPRAVAALDDALVLLYSGLDPSAAPQHDVLHPVRRALEHYTEIVHSSTAQPRKSRRYRRCSR